MLRNYLISALRNIAKNKFYSLLNILGLSIGMTAFIFILIFVRDELTYDKHNDKHERIHRIESNFSISNREETFAVVPVPMAPAFMLEFPEVENFVRFTGAGNALMEYKDISYYEDRIFFTDLH